MTRQVDADVRLSGRSVGRLQFDRGGSIFEYHDGLAGPDHLVLGQEFEEDPGLRRRERVGLPSWFANLLPEGALREYVVRDLGGGRIGDYTLLLRLGEYLPGAVTVHGEAPPDDVLPESARPVSADYPLRHSFAGVQLKLSVPSERLTIPASGSGGWWIVKFPYRDLPDLPVNEYLTMSWLSAAGFRVPDVELVPAETVESLPPGLARAGDLLYLIKRFDRAASGPVHVEDFAQIVRVHPRHKYGEFGETYDSIGALIAGLLGADGFADYVGRLTAMVVVGNDDAHLKNWALRYPDGRTPELAPIYDFHSLSYYSQYRSRSSLALSLNGEKMSGRLEVEDFRRLADHAGMDADLAADVVAETVSALRDAWRNDIGKECGLTLPTLAEYYSQRLVTLPICRV